MQRKIKQKRPAKFYGNKLLTLFIFIIILMSIYIFTNFNSTFVYPSLQKTELMQQDIKLNLLFTGDIFLSRHIDVLTKRDNLNNQDLYSYPFSGLGSLEKRKYDTWIGNLECPITVKQSTPYELENYLKFSCKKEYLPQLKKYFDIVSLANNHTDNMGGKSGLEETRGHLKNEGIKYFGDYDNSQTEKLCEIFYIQNGSTDIPIAFCGFHGVFSLPKDNEIEIIKNYSKYFITFVMPHQGEEYKGKSNTYQKKIYHKFVDAGADAVMGSHPHVIQEVEEYKNKIIFYSLGNFIFDQNWSKTREHMVVKTEISFPKYKDNYKNLSCQTLKNQECLQKAADLKITKPEFTLKYEPIFTHSDLNFITKKRNLTEDEYQKKLKGIGFDRIDDNLKHSP